MWQYEYNGKALGKILREGEQWLYCGLLDGEDKLSPEHQKAFCGGDVSILSVLG